MRIEIPDMGVEQATVAEILVKVGDQVTAEQSLMVVESDKAAVEVPSPQAGTIREILVKTGDSVQQGDAVFELDDEQGQEDKADATSDDEASASDTETEHRSQQRTDATDADTKDVNAKDDDAPAPEHTTDQADDTAEQNAQQNDKQQDDKQQNGQVQSVTVPDIGVEKAQISEILVKVGDQIEAEQSIVLLESDKAAVEVPSPAAGTVQSIAVKVGDSVKEGVVLLELALAASTANDASSAESQSTDTSSKQSAQNAMQQPAKNQSSEPQSLETQSSVNQSSKNQPEKNQPSDTQSTDTSATTAAADADTSAPPVLSPAQQQDNAQVHAGPAVRQLARQLGVALKDVKATGQHERIVKDDVLAYVKQRMAQPAAAQTNTDSAVPAGLPKLPNFDQYGGGDWQKLTRLQQVSIPQLSLNNYIPQVTQFDLADITDLEAWRESIKADYKNQGISLTILAFIAKAVAHLLTLEPNFAAHLSDDAQSILLRHEIHMGIAVATPDGLTVPVLRHPDQKSIGQIAQELMTLSQKARDKKLSPKDLQGANFSITSLGSIGGTAFTPLVNWPQVAILGISPASLQPVWDGAQFVPRLMLPLSLSYDHRVINGADAARFTHRLTQILQDIRQILL